MAGGIALSQRSLFELQLAEPTFEVNELLDRCLSFGGQIDTVTLHAILVETLLGSGQLSAELRRLLLQKAEALLCLGRLALNVLGQEGFGHGIQRAPDLCGVGTGQAQAQDTSAGSASAADLTDHQATTELMDRGRYLVLYQGKLGARCCTQIGY